MTVTSLAPGLSLENKTKKQLPVLQLVNFDIALCIMQYFLVKRLRATACAGRNMSTFNIMSVAS